MIGVVGQTDRPGGAADHAHGAGEQAVVRADQHRLAVLAHLDGDRTPSGADTGIDHGEDHARNQVLDAAGERQGAGPDVVGRDLVGDVDDGGVRSDRADDRLDDADELVDQAVVRQERDRVAATARAALDQPAWV